MSKVCPLCHKQIADEEIVVVLLLAKFRAKPESYDLELMGQTICSHVLCAQAKDK